MTHKIHFLLISTSHNLDVKKCIICTNEKHNVFSNICTINHFILFQVRDFLRGSSLSILNAMNDSHIVSE